MTPDRELNLVLIGFMATGKSTIGRRCARALGYRFRDSDVVVERRAGKSVSRIFAEEGEPAFRSLEADVIRDLCYMPRAVVATGGGAPLNPLNAARLRRNAVVVLLRVDPEEIVRRASRRGTRPLLAGAPDPRLRVVELLDERSSAYLAAAHAVVDTTGLTPDEATERVLEVFRRTSTRRSRQRTSARLPASPTREGQAPRSDQCRP